MPYKRTDTKHSYLLSVERSHAGVGNNYLSSSIYFDDKYLDKIILSEINSNELLLNSGRFKNYSVDEQKYKTQIVLRKAGLYEITNKTSQILDFIGLNIKSKWHLVAWVTSFNSSGELIYDFSFEDKNEAMAIKLAYS